MRLEREGVESQLQDQRQRLEQGVESQLQDQRQRLEHEFDTRLKRELRLQRERLEGATPRLGDDDEGSKQKGRTPSQPHAAKDGCRPFVLQ